MLGYGGPPTMGVLWYVNRPVIPKEATGKRGGKFPHGANPVVAMEIPGASGEPVGPDKDRLVVFY